MERNNLGCSEVLGALEIEHNLLRLVAGIGNLHYKLLGGLVVNGAGIETIFALNGLAVLGELQHVGTLIGAIKHLNIPVDRAHTLQVVEPDEVGTPLPAINMGEERSVSALPNNVGVALKACHESGLRECGLPIVLGYRGLAILAGDV